MSDGQFEELLSLFSAEERKSGGLDRKEGESDDDYEVRLCEAAEAKYKKRQTNDHRLPAVKTLNAIKQVSKSGAHRADNIREDVAKDWAAGYSNNPAGSGMSVRDTFGVLETLLRLAKDVDSHLAKAPANAEEAGDIWDAYDSALDDLWSILRTIRGKIENDGIRQYIGPACKKHFAEQVKVWEVLAPKMVSVVGPKLDEEQMVQKERPAGFNSFTQVEYKRTTAKLEEWGPKTLGYMKQCLEKASG